MERGNTLVMGSIILMVFYPKAPLRESTIICS